jgi:phosphatidylglycerophosphatase A
VRLHDPGAFVFDEFVGQWTALLFVARGPWWAVLSAFALFRLFDVWKPFPVGWADRRLRGGLGVMADDVLAGLMAAAVLALALRVLA